MVDTLLLNGAWTLEEACGVQQIPAQVPGSVLNDLLNNHLIPDPFVGENELITTPLFDRDYAYQRTFQVNAAFLAREHVELLFEGLDTLATVYVNGQEIGKADNMHRSWRFDVKRALHSGENRLRVVLASPNQFLKKAIADHPDVTYEAVGTMRGNFALRKAHCMFGWDWGPQLPDAGIWRPVSLESWNGARLAEVRVLQSHEDGKVRLTITPVTRGGEAGLPCRVELMQPDGSLCVRAEARTGETTELTVEQPQLWWPNGLGKHPLYTLRVTLLSDSGEAADRWSRRVGLRTLTVERKPDQWGESFDFACNGVPFFAMGADYIPEDNLIPRVNKERTRRLLADCVAAHFNAVRVWGGGYYPNDFFFDLCDEMGLVVWLDLMFACNVYELTDTFRENIRLEAIENMLRVRDHACLGLVCGNNEMETAWCNWDDVSCHCDRLRQQYLEQFEDVLKNAQELGYAERNPAADIEGWDACRKIAILSSLAYGHHVDFEEIYTEGITKITSADIRYAKAFGATIKLLASSKRIGDKYYAMVCPVMINGDSPLFSVNDVFNAIVIHGNMLGDAMFYGSGAGKLPTASAVVADVVDAAKHLNRFIMTGWSSEKLEMIDVSQVESRFFVRMKGSYTESLAKVEEVFGTIDAKVVAEVGKEFGFITSKMQEEEYRAKAAQFDNIIGMIRVRF